MGGHGSRIMKLTRPSQLVRLLRESNIRPRKALGQHFLIDQNTLDEVLRIAKVTPTDHVLEVGAGLGVLTDALLETGATVTAVEKDRKLFALLSRNLEQHEGSLNLWNADAMDLDLQDLIRGGINKMVSNLPYGIGTRLVLDLIELERAPQTMIVLLQKDLGERLASDPGTKNYGAATVLSQTRYQITLCKRVKPTCFFPSPKVESAIVALERWPSSKFNVQDRPHLRRLVKWVFSQRRKQLGTTLRSAPQDIVASRNYLPTILLQANLSPQRRPGTLSVVEWCTLSNLLSEKSHAHAVRQAPLDERSTNVWPRNAR